MKKLLLITINLLVWLACSTGSSRLGWGTRESDLDPDEILTDFTPYADATGQAGQAL